MRKNIIFIFLLFPLTVATIMGKGNPEDTSQSYKIAVVIPGVVTGNSLYEQLVAGVQKAVEESPGARMKVLELGFNQAEWAEGLTSVVATKSYDVIITSNPSMPAIALEIAQQFPEQKFVFFEGFIEAQPQMTSYLYNQKEQSYLLGHMAGLITTSSIKGANSQLKIGLIVGQEYPTLDKIMIPGFMEGARAVNPDISLDMRVIGNWYDANKAAELAKIMIDEGVDIIGVIAGAAAPGVFKVSHQRGTYALFWDSNAYETAPGVIVGCVALEQERLAYEVASKAIKGQLEMGKAHILSLRDGYVEFISDDPNYIKTVPQALRDRQQDLVDSIDSGELLILLPRL